MIDRVKPKYDGNSRTLYVPQGVVDWDSTFNHGVKLIKEGHSVQLHEHGIAESCGTNGATRCGELTRAESGAILVADSTGAAPTPSEIEN